MTEKPLAFLSLIKVLETAVGHRTTYAQLEPFACNTLASGKPDTIAIQKAAKTIARHVGLDDFTFIVSTTMQAPSTAGHIELRYGEPEVFIEVSEDILTFEDAVLATLCHEVAHKFLHVNGIRHGTLQLEQEFLTDVAAVFLGMGKIMLNGCECQRAYSKTENGRTVTTAETLKVGYISRECFAFVYRLICGMRRLPRDEYLKGLSESARQALLTCEARYSDWFIPQLHAADEVELFRRRLQERLQGVQTRFAEHDYSLRSAQKVLEAAHADLQSSHRPLVEADAKIAELSKRNDNPHLNHLNCLETQDHISGLLRAGEIHILRAETGLKDIAVIAKRVGAEPSDTEIVECPNDRTRLRVPSGRNALLVTCSACKYRFVVRTAPAAPPARAPSDDARQTSKRFLKSLKAAFGRR